jgi:hypothetical protein
MFSAFLPAKCVVMREVFTVMYDCAHEFVVYKHAMRTYEIICQALNVYRIKYYAWQMKADTSTLIFSCSIIRFRRSQWPRRLRHELSSLARILRSEFESHSRHACLFVRLFCVCVVLCVGSDLETGWSPVQGVISTVYKIKKLKKLPKLKKGL